MKNKYLGKTFSILIVCMFFFIGCGKTSKSEIEMSNVTMEESNSTEINDTTEVIRLTEEMKWYENTMIAHAGGGIDGKVMTNSLEAIDLAIQNGYKLIEIDFAFTSDDVLVLKHDWYKENAYALELPTSDSEQFIPDAKSFKMWKINRKYTTLTAADLVEWMKAHPDIYIVVDSKEVEKKIIQKQLKVLVELCNENVDLLNRFIIQIYNFEMYDWVKEIYEFPNCLFSIYTIAEPSEEFFAKLAAYCIDNNIKVVTIPKDYLWQPFIDVLKDNGLIVYTHTLNTISELERAINMRIDGVYTDFLYESDIEYIVLEQTEQIE